MPQNPEQAEPGLGSSDSPNTNSEGSNGASHDVAAEANTQDTHTIAPPAYGLGQSGGGQPPSPYDYDYEDGSESNEEGGAMGRMSFFDHLEELRRRIFYSLIAIAVGMGVCWSWADDIYAGLAKPLTTVLSELKLDPHLVYTSPTGPFNLYMRMAMIGGLFLSAPVVLFQVWKFISPGLYRHEKKYAFPFVLFCSTLFISGGAFAYFVAFPAALRFLLSYGAQFKPFITVDEYFSLATTIILGLAIVFELPVFILFLALLRIVTPGFLLRNFRYAFLLIIILAAVLTPTSDVVNMMIFAAPLMALYFLGIGLSWLVLRSRKAPEPEAEA